MNTDKEIFKALNLDSFTDRPLEDDEVVLVFMGTLRKAWRAFSALDEQKAGPSDEEIEALAKQHLWAHAENVGAGNVYVEGEVAFARALLSKYAAPQASAEVRNAALEEAAVICDRLAQLVGRSGGAGALAKEIRALKSHPTEGGAEPVKVPSDEEIKEVVTSVANDLWGAGYVEWTQDDTLFYRRVCHALLTKYAAPAPKGEPVAVLRYERNVPGRENEMPRVVSCNRLPDGEYPVYAAPVNEQKRIKELEAEVAALKAARIAYASEFPLNEDGDPDVGNIHSNIRALKVVNGQDAKDDVAEGAPKVEIGRDVLVDLISTHLSETYHCTRVWEAWSYGTMGPDDFEDVSESDTPGEIADAVLSLINSTDGVKENG